MTEWQPTTIRKLKITGNTPLFQCTSERIGNNMTQVLESRAPHNYPGGGSFSLNLYTLEGLYKLHTKARNWWTTSNCKLPLVRYTGCKIKLFRSLTADYIFFYTTCGKLEANLDLYQSAQPSILSLNKRKRIITCKQHNHHRKPYKTLHIKPPALWSNKWYTQQEIAKMPLLLTVTSAASLDRYYISAQAKSNTIGFTSLNTETFQYHDFKIPPTTTGYVPNDKQLLFTVHPWHGDIKQVKWGHLIYLGNTNEDLTGTPVGQKPAHVTSWHTWVDTWASNKEYWGNPFHAPYLSGDNQPILITNKTINDIKTKLKNLSETTVNTTLIDTDFAQKTIPQLWDCRYNPEADTSQNAVFFAKITQGHDTWKEPTEERLICKGLPLWYLLHGFVDFHAKALDIQRLQTDWVLCIVSDAITPAKDYYVPLDYWFLNGQSPYETQEGHKTIYDDFNWHPKVNFQTSTISKINGTGPATVKLPDNISCEGHCSYTFYFKLGGCPPPMDEVCDPAAQPDYPRPNNILPTTLLQDPQTPIQYYLQSFDERRGLLTKTAAKRLKTDWFTTETLFTTPGQSSLDLPGPTKETSSDEETPPEEKDPQTLQLQLKLHRRKQRKLQQRILDLLTMNQTL